MAYIRKTVDINISDEIKEVLLKFKDNSKFANLLLSKRINKDILVDDFVDYISISKEDKLKISYLTKDRSDKMISSGECLWTSNKRYHCKPGAFLSKIFKDVSERDALEFSNYYKSFADIPRFNFSIVNGDDIVKYYHYGSYSNGDGSLGASCMRHSKCSNFMGIYKENKNISMLIMKDDNDMLIGRSLLWELPEYKIMDRIYTCNDERLTIHFKKWATDNGYLYKTQQTFNNTISFKDDKTEPVELALEVDIDNLFFDYYPYLDTFKWIDFEKGKMYNYLPRHFVDNHKYKLLMDGNGRFYPCKHLLFDSVDRVYKQYDSLFEIQPGVYAEPMYVEYNELESKYELNSYAMSKIAFMKLKGTKLNDMFPEITITKENVITEDVEIVWDTI